MLEEAKNRTGTSFVCLLTWKIILSIKARFHCSVDTGYSIDEVQDLRQIITTVNRVLPEK